MSQRVRKIITVIIGVSLLALLAVGAFIVVRLSQESQAPSSSFACWCAGADQCGPAGGTLVGANGQCGDTGLNCCVVGGGSGGGGGACLCDGWAQPNSEHCNPGLNRIYQCSSSCNWIDTGRNCSGGTTQPPPATQCGDARCEAPENGTNCVQDCGTTGTPGGGGGGATNSCSGAGNHPQCDQIGEVIAYSGGTCICSRTTGTLCGCVPTTGTSCQIQEDGCTTMGASCRDSTGTAANPPTNRVGTCISNGTVNGQLKCSCNPAPDVGQGGSSCGDGICINEERISTNAAYCPADCGAGGQTCSLDSDCTTGSYCSQGSCNAKSSNGGGCTANNQCLSGNCVTISGGSRVCQAAGTGSNSCSPAGASCNNPTGGGSNGFCNNGNCVQLAAVNGSCTTDSACQSGLVCLSLRCRQPVADDSNPTVSCTSGQWYCAGAVGCGGGQGKLCSNGTLQDGCTVADACASTSDQTVSQGMSCSGLRALSGGEALNGIFVGCSGRLNCFCSSLSGSASVNCIPDVGNDSCGASGTEPVAVLPGQEPPQSVTPPPPGSLPPPPPGTPYCGDGLCAVGEACERTSPSSNTFAACSSASGAAPTGPSVSACYGIELNQPDTTSTCQYCGDGVFTPGREQCDATAPAGNGNNPTQCNPGSCTLQATANQCIDLVENGVDPIRSGTGNFMIYTFVYRHASSSNPFPNIRLRVGPSGTPVGRDANNTGSSLVLIVPATGYVYDSVTSTHTYRFRWEAASPAGTAVADGTYDVRVLTDGTTETTDPAACTESLQVQSTAEQQPLFTIIKQSAPVCVSDGSVQINYTITATNIGPVSGVIDFVRDTLDSAVVAAGVTPTNINPSFGTYASGVITWVGSVSDRTFAAGQSKQYTYRITIPQTQVINFVATGVINQALVQFDTTTTTDNTDSFDLRTFLSCSQPSIPDTGIFDDGRFLLIGLILTIVGILVYRSDITRKITRPLVVSSKR